MSRTTTLHVARFDDLNASTLYALLRLRLEVFVVEQRCAYPELDGRDLEPGTRHLWLAASDDPRPLAYLRLLSEPDGVIRIGRVCTAADARSRGLARRLVGAALDLIGAQPSTLDAQAYLVDFYAGLGFTPSGAEYVDDDGIPHVPMRRDGAYGSPATRSTTERRRPV
jgi:ElaA protein